MPSIITGAGGPLDLYNDHHICAHFGMFIDEDKDQCVNSDSFSRFLGLLESIPFHYTGQNEHAESDSRYIYFLLSFGPVAFMHEWRIKDSGLVAAAVD